MTDRVKNGHWLGGSSMKTAVRAIAIVALLQASACAPGNGGAHSVPKKGLANYKRATCLYAFDQGDEAVQAAREVRASLFGKTIDFGPLRSVARASAAATVERIRRQGAEVYGAPDSGRGCITFKSLSGPPGDLVQEW